MLAEADEAAHPVFCGGDDHIARAAVDTDAAEEEAYKSSHTWFVGALVINVNMSVDVEVDELCAARHDGKRSDELCVDRRLGGAIANGERMAVAIEGAAEFMATTTRHASDGDVIAQFHGHAAEAVPCVVVLKGIAEVIPTIRIADDERTLGTAVGRVAIGLAKMREIGIGVIDGGAKDGRALAWEKLLLSVGLDARRNDEGIIGQSRSSDVVGTIDIARHGNVPVARGDWME